MSGEEKEEELSPLEEEVGLVLSGQWGPIDPLLRPLCAEIGNDTAKIYKGIRAGMIVAAQTVGRLATEKLSPIPTRQRKRPDPKILVPICQKAALEEDPDMQEMWANLLAKSMVKGDENFVHPSFPDILSELSPVDAKCLNLAYEMQRQSDEESGASHGVCEKELKKKFGLTSEQIYLSSRILERQGLCSSPASRDERLTCSTHICPHCERAITIDILQLGEQFVDACCTPPQPSKKTKQKPS